MPTVRVKENEPFEVAMRRFKRTVEKTGLLTELRSREYYEKPTAERKRKLAAADKRRRDSKRNRFSHFRDGRRGSERHGQGDGHAQVPARRQSRHGQSLRARQSAPRRLKKPAQRRFPRENGRQSK